MTGQSSVQLYATYTSQVHNPANSEWGI